MVDVMGLYGNLFPNVNIEREYPPTIFLNKAARYPHYDSSAPPYLSLFGKYRKIRKANLFEPIHKNTNRWG